MMQNVKYMIYLRIVFCLALLAIVVCMVFYINLNNTPKKSVIYNSQVEHKPTFLIDNSSNDKEDIKYIGYGIIYGMPLNTKKLISNKYYFYNNINEAMIFFQKHISIARIIIQKKYIDENVANVVTMIPINCSTATDYRPLLGCYLFSADLRNRHNDIIRIGGEITSVDHTLFYASQKNPNIYSIKVLKAFHSDGKTEYEFLFQNIDKTTHLRSPCITPLYEQGHNPIQDSIFMDRANLEKNKKDAFIK